MRKLMGLLAFVTAFAFAGVTLAQDKPAATPDKPAAAAEAAKPAAAPAVKPPEPNKGDTTWMLVCTALVLMMSVPALALFYGGLVRTKNMLSLLMQVFMIVSIAALVWCCWGYSLAFTSGTPFIGGLSKAFLAGVSSSTYAATFTNNVYLPELVFLMFQMTFACITPALIVGAFAERRPVGHRRPGRAAQRTRPADRNRAPCHRDGHRAVGGCAHSAQAVSQDARRLSRCRTAPARGDRHARRAGDARHRCRAADLRGSAAAGLCARGIRAHTAHKGTSIPLIERARRRRHLRDRRRNRSRKTHRREKCR